VDDWQFDYITKLPKKKKKKTPIGSQFIYLFFKFSIKKKGEFLQKFTPSSKIYTSREKKNPCQNFSKFLWEENKIK
jgi:hypothetical protein